MSTMKTLNSKQRAINILNNLILPLLCVFAVSSFPALFMYFQNADESYFSEILKPLFIFVSLGLIFFLIFLIVSKNTFKAAAITSLFMIVILNYALLEKVVRFIIPSLRYWHIVLISIFIFAHIVWFICKKIPIDIINTVTRVICMVFCGLILFNLFMAAPTIVKKISIEKDMKKQNQIEQKTNENLDLPNIYFIILDEYSSIDFMKKYYDYDNTAFAQYLEGLGFNISYTSHNESIQTTTVTTNLVNFDYVVHDGTSSSEKKALRTNNKLFKYLTEKGYTIKGIGSSEPYGLENAALDTSNSNSTTITGETISDLLFRNTVIGPFYTVSRIEDVRIILSAFSYLHDTNNFSNSGDFTICHLISPHVPFYFDRHGNVYDNPSIDWTNKKYYLEQYIFITNKVIETVDSITKHNPDSIIIIQSDHGARANTDPELTTKLFSYNDASNVFNAVYYKGEKFDIEGLSGVNTIRLLLNIAFGENFDMLEVPSNNK